MALGATAGETEPALSDLQRWPGRLLAPPDGSFHLSRQREPGQRWPVELGIAQSVDNQVRTASHGPGPFQGVSRVSEKVSDRFPFLLLRSV